jgi:hypothetical protein
VCHSTEHSLLKVFTAITKDNVLHEHGKWCTTFCNMQDEAKHGDLMIPPGEVQQITAISTATVNIITQTLSCDQALDFFFRLNKKSRRQ